MSAREQQSSDQRAITERVDLLIRLLAAQMESHRRLLGCLERKRAAIRSADVAEMHALCAQENTIIQRLGAAEKQRLSLVGEITERFAPDAEIPLSLREIAERMDQPRREALGELAQSLRETISTVKQESSIVTAAAQTLSRHMAGIMQSVHGALNRARVYERKGKVALGTQTDYCVDIRS